MLTLIINYATILASIAFILDNIIQTYHILKGKSSDDISLRGEIIRLIAVVILFIKFILVKDMILIVGEGIFLLTFLVYYAILVRYHKKPF